MAKTIHELAKEIFAAQNELNKAKTSVAFYERRYNALVTDAIEKGLSYETDKVDNSDDAVCSG